MLPRNGARDTMQASRQLWTSLRKCLIQISVTEHGVTRSSLMMASAVAELDISAPPAVSMYLARAIIAVSVVREWTVI